MLTSSSEGLDTSAVQLGMMDGLPGLAEAFRDSFPNARVARCWVHRARNVFPRVPKRYQAEFKTDWDAMQFADSKAEAQAAFATLEKRWQPICGEAVDAIRSTLDELLVHYEFPREHWEALRTTNPIERVNKEFKRRSKSMDTVSANGLIALLAFTALRLEYGWATTPITSAKLNNLPTAKRRQQALESAAERLLH